MSVGIVRIMRGVDIMSVVVVFVVLSAFQVLMRLFLGCLRGCFRIRTGVQSVDGLSQLLRRRAGHCGLQLIEGNTKVLRDVNSGNKLPQVFEALSGCLQVSSRRKQGLELG